MAKYRIKSPEGETFEITAPDDASQEDVLKYAQDQFAAKTIAPAAPAEPAAPPLAENTVARQVGLTARGGVEGAASLPLAAGNIMNTLINLGIDKFNEISGTNIPKLNMPGEVVSRRLTDLGVPVPQTDLEEAVLAGTKGMAGGASMAGLAGAVAPVSTVGKGIAQTLAANPGVQVGGGLTAGMSADVARQAGAGPMGQMAAGFAGGMIPSAGAIVPNVTRGLLRSGKPTTTGFPTKTAENVDIFEKAGTMPSMAQATEGRGARLTEGMLGKAPISTDIMRDKYIGEQADIGAKVGAQAEKLYPGAEPMVAGREIEKGVGSFVRGFKATANELYDRVDQFVPPDQEVPVTNYKATLGRMTTPDPGAPASTGQLIQPKLKAMASALESDLNPQLQSQPVTLPSGQTFQISPELQRTLGITSLAKNTLPYSALKDLRSRIGSLLSTNELLSDIPKAELKQVYAALSNDMENAALINDADAGYYGPAGQLISQALKTGTPLPPEIMAGIKAQPGPALNAVNRASQYYKAGIDRIDRLQSVVDKMDPEKIFTAAISGSKDGATQIRAVMKSLPPEARDAISAVMIKRMGKATAGNQSAAGDVFSTETFLTNWNKLTPEVKTQLFTDHDVRDSLNAVAKAAEKLRMGKRTYANPSGSGSATIQGTTTLGTIISSLGFAYAGMPGAALATAATGATTVGGLNLGARLMTSPRFVRWLAQTANDKHVQSQLGVQLNSLAETTSDAQERSDIEALRDRLAPPPPQMKAGGSVSARQLLRASKRYS